MQSLPPEVSSKVGREEESYPKDTSSVVMCKKGGIAQSSSPPNHLGNTPEGSSNATTSLGEEEDDEVQIIEDASKQLVIYNPAANGVVQNEPISDAVEYIPPSYRTYAPTPAPRVLPSVGAFTVQCAQCMKWRLIPTKEKYEEIRESILQQPFICDRAREWRPDICCDEPADISQDGSRLWAIDKPNISQPPPGWDRQLRIRGEGSSKFADVYYAAPSGKKLRSMVEVQKYLLEHPQDGVTISQFSFQTPKPLQVDYVRKRQRPNMKSLEPAEVNPLSWAGPVGEPELQLGPPGMSSSSASYGEGPLAPPSAPPAKKKRRKSPSKDKAVKSPSKYMYNSQNTYSQPDIKVENLQSQNNHVHDF